MKCVMPIKLDIYHFIPKEQKKNTKMIFEIPLVFRGGIKAMGLFQIVNVSERVEDCCVNPT